MKNRIKLILLFTLSINLVSAANFRDGSLSYLNGNDYLVEPDKQQTLTFEYVAAWDSWDMFMFIDYKKYDQAGNSYYGEFSPRLKLMAFNENNVIKKISFATTFERGKNGVSSNLFGFGIDFNTSIFRFLNMNLYQRDDPDISGKGYQLTTVWAYNFKVAEIPFLLDGYFDWIFSSNESEENMHFNPQIKMDMKKWLGGAQQWYLGIEYDYWDNKYGIKDSAEFETRQNTFSFLAKWHF